VNAIAHPVPGNREYGSGSAAGYFAYFGARAGPSPGGFYSYDVGRWHLIALNSNCGFVPCGAGSAQEAWLRSDLAAHPGACQLAYWHAPLFNSGTVGRATSMTQIWQDLQAAGVEVVLNGHDHHYERFAPQDASGAPDPTGPREFIVGTGGASHAAVPAFAARNSEVRNYDTYGVLRLTLREGGYDWRFAPEAGRSFTDAGSESCH
jgi:acid phosphatase type 7